MGTIKKCLDVVKNFGAEDFDNLDARARAIAGDATLTNEHYIEAAEEIVKEYEASLAELNNSQRKEPDAPTPVNDGKEAPAPAAEKVENKDLTSNVPSTEAERKAKLLRAFESLKAKLGDRLLATDEGVIEAAFEIGDLETAQATMREIVDLVKQRRYRTNEPQKVPTSPTSAISHEALEKIVSDVEAALGGKAGITIMDSVTQFDPSQKAGSRAGVMDRGNIILFRDGIPNGIEGLKTVFHELFHKGLRKLVPEAEYTQFLNNLYNQSGEIRALADAWLAENKADVEQYSPAQQRAAAVDEVLADMAENTQLKPSTLRQLGQFFAKIADRFGLTKLVQWLRGAPPTPLQQFINDALRASVGGAAPAYGTNYRTAKESYDAISATLKYDVLGKLRRGVLRTSFLRDLNERFGKDLPAIGKYMKGTFDMSKVEAEIQEVGERVNAKFNALSAKELKEVTELMADATASDIAVEGDNKHVAKTDVSGQAQITVLKARFAKLNAKQKAAYRTSRDELAKLWKKRGELMAAIADEVYNPLIQGSEKAGDVKTANKLKRERIEYLRDTNKLVSSIQGDYFPMMRFGDWMVIRKSAKYEAAEKAVDDAYKALDDLLAKYDNKTPDERKAQRKKNEALKKAGVEVEEDFTPEQTAEIAAARKAYNDAQTALDDAKSSEADYEVTAFESESEARAHEAKFGGYTALRRSYVNNSSPISRTMLSRLDESLKHTLGASGNVGAVRDAKKALYDIFLSSLPDRSAMKRQLKRKNVAGFERDMRRSIASSILRDSFFLSRMEFSDEIGVSLLEAQRQADESRDTKIQEVVRELNDRWKISNTFTETPVQDKLSSLAYIWRLGVSPGYLIANMLQPGMVTMPMLWSRHGFKTNKVFSKAYADVAALIQKGGIKDLGQLDFSSLPKDEVKMLDEMLKQNLLNVTLVQELARTAEGKGINWVSSMLAKPSHYVEQVNRITSALAAYRLEKTKGTEEQATAYAARVLADTHFDYSSENAPYWMKPGALPLGKLVFQFKKYQLGMISLLTKTVARAVKDADPKVRSEARKQLLGIAATHAAVGGALGLPAAGTLTFLANMIAKAFGDDDEPWDAEVEFRNWAVDTLGKEAGDVLAKGLPTLLGADMSQKVGLGDVLNPFPTLRTDKQGRDFWLEVLAAGLGPAVGGLGSQAMDGMSYMARGDFVKAVEAFLPKFLADGVRAGRFAAEGVTTKAGVEALGKDQISGWDVFLQAAGVPSANITDSYEARTAVESHKRGMNEIADKAKKSWLEARKDGDSEAAAEAWQNIREKVNPARVRNGLKPITMSDLIKFQRNRGKEEASYAKFGANVGKNAKMANVARFAQDE